jgi:hypothetical protein
MIFGKLMSASFNCSGIIQIDDYAHFVHDLGVSSKGLRGIEKSLQPEFLGNLIFKVPSGSIEGVMRTI